MPAPFRYLPRITKIAGATGLSVGLALGGYGIAQAASGGSAPSAAPPAVTPGAATPAPGPWIKGGGRIAAAAKALNLTPTALLTELQGGKSIADVARSKNIDPATVVDAMVTDAQSHLKDQITAEVNRPFSARGPRGFGHRGGANLATVAGALGIPEATVRSELMAGKSLAQVAQENGKTADDVIKALVTERTSEIDREVAAGKLTQAQADTMKSSLKDRITAMVNHAPQPGGPGRFGHGDPEGPDDPASGPTPSPAAPGA
ncbi:MAG: hypothetical protein NVSMB4_07620 [Acidimicrobiales bacterium]